MLSKICHFIKIYLKEIIFYIIIFLALMLSFATGYLVCKSQLKEPIEIEVCQ